MGRNLPALSFLSARHVVSPLKVKLKIVLPNREKFGRFVKGERPPKNPFFGPFLFFYLVHRLADQGDGFSAAPCLGGLVAEHLAVPAGAGESGEQPVEVLHEDGGGASVGGLLFYVGEVGFQERFPGRGACFPCDNIGGIVAFGADVAENPFVGIVQEPRVLVRFAADHHSVQIIKLLLYLVECLDAAVDADVQVRHLGLEAVDKIVVQRRDFAVLLGAETLEPGLARVDDEHLATRVADSLYKISEEFPAVELVDPDAALDGHGDAHRILHGLETVGDDILVLHEACAEVSVLHAVRRAAAVQVDFLESRGFYEFGCACEIAGIAAAQLQYCRLFDWLVPEEHVGIFAMQKPACHDHLAVQQDVPREQTQKIALVTVGAVKHRRNRKTAAVV